MESDATSWNWRDGLPEDCPPSEATPPDGAILPDSQDRPTGAGRLCAYLLQKPPLRRTCYTAP